MSNTVDTITKEVIEEKLLHKGWPEKIKMTDQINQMNQSAHNTSFREIARIDLKRKILYYFKALVRKINYWYIEPCMRQQTEFNVAGTRFSEAVCDEIGEIRDRIDATDKYEVEIEELRTSLSELMVEHAKQKSAYESRIAELEQKVADLSADTGKAGGQ